MFLAANPEKGKNSADKADIARKYKPGDNVLPKVEQKVKSLRERRVDDEDRILMNEIRDLSLREVGIGAPEARRERRRREGERSHGSRTRPSHDQASESRSADGRERRRRREDSGRRQRENEVSRSDGSFMDERRRRRSEDRRREEENHNAVRQIEHQSSLRSLLSSSDLDSNEIEEEILRQIREENLLEGIDLDNIDVSQEDQISERIAEAFRRRHGERRRHGSGRRGDSNDRRRQHPGASTPDLRDALEDSSRSPRRRRHQSNSPRATSPHHEPSRPPLSTSTGRAHLEVQSPSEERRHRRTTSRSRSATAPIATSETEVQTAARSQTDLSRWQTTELSASRQLMSTHRRNNTDPNVTRSVEAPLSDQPHQEQTTSASRSPRARQIIRAEDSPSSPCSSVPAISPGHPFDAFVPSSAPSAASQAMTDQSLYPAPLSPRHQPNLAERVTAISSGTRPLSTSSTSSATLRSRPQLYPEPYLTCARCSKPHIEYELHYNCAICHGGNWNICVPCYRSSSYPTRPGCLHWFGFGAAAWERWNELRQSGELPAGAEKPHMLTANRYVQPKIPEGGADGRRTLTTEDPKKRLQSGTFCANCFAWTNECYWRCEICNDGDWGFCNPCVNCGKSCTHPLLPLIYKPTSSSTPPLTPTQDHQTPASASILTGPGVLDIGPFKPLTFSTKCDVCHYPIQPSSSRYHCFSCTSAVPGTLQGDYDICNTCYPKLVTSRRISFENGHNGWRRCLQGHRMVILGFEDSNGGQRRIILRDLIGGRGVHEEPFSSIDHPGAELQKWSWSDGPTVRVKIVSTDVMKTAPSFVPGVEIEKDFPPDGGVGMWCVSSWSWWPEEGANDELLFPKEATIKECKDVNGDWFHGCYLGERGLFPANYVKVLDSRRGK